MMAFAAAACLMLAQTETNAAEYEARLEQAAHAYNADAALSLSRDVEAYYDANHDRDTAFLLARTLQLVADLHRMHYEMLPDDDGDGRRALGAIIDGAATKALDLLEVMDNTSEVWRMRADLYGAMIRSDYRATRFRKRMDDAIATALALDPDNPRAHVSAARPLVFADRAHGQDFEAALKLLEQALALDPALESARVLKAVTLEKLGRIDEAKAQWRALLEDNSECLPAERRLRELEASQS